MKVIAVTPIWNEKIDTIKSVIRDLDSYVDAVVMVDDGSTIPEARDYKSLKKSNRVFLLRHELNRGQGAALETGTRFACLLGADIIIHFDSDGQHRAEDLPKFLQILTNQEADIVFGSRFLHKKISEIIQEKEVPKSKMFFLLPIARVVNWMFTGLWLTDAHNGLRAFTRKSSDSLHLTQDMMAHATEYLQLVKKNRLRFKEVPVKFRYNHYGQGLRGGLVILKELILKI